MRSFEKFAERQKEYQHLKQCKSFDDVLNHMNHLIETGILTKKILEHTPFIELERQYFGSVKWSLISMAIGKVK